MAPPERIVATVVYFVPRDGTPLPDWRDRVAYVCARIEAFHARELGGQSHLATAIHPAPFRSAWSTSELRVGDATFTFLQTLGEVDRALGFAAGEPTAFPVLLVLSDINWGDLEDFYRLLRVGGETRFEGALRNGQHFPGAPSGGARAAYVPERGVGLALVSADGWRVPYRGSDCVVYHELGHAIGLRHPERPDGSVMSHGQYRGWLNESWLARAEPRRDLFSVFTAVPDPLVPTPDQEVVLRMTWPGEATVKRCRVGWQTALLGPWTEHEAAGSEVFSLGRFDAPTPVSYRVRAELADGQTVELWGYFQVRSAPDVAPQPPAFEPAPEPLRLGTAVDLLALIDPELQPGARIHIPYDPPEEYVLTVIVTPLDPGRLLLGHRRFAVVLEAPLLVTARPAAIVCTVRRDGVSVTCEGLAIPLADDARDDALFVGAVGGRYRFDWLELAPLAR